MLYLRNLPRNEDLALADVTMTSLEVTGYVGIMAQNELRLYEGVNYVGFEAPALTANQIWILPTADGDADQVLRTDGSGTLSWASAAAGSGVVELDDTDANQKLTLDWSEDGAADYILDFKVNAASRTINLSEDFTIADGGDVTITAVGAARSLTLNESLTIGDGNDGTLTFSAASKVLTVEDNATVSQDMTSDASPVFAGLEVNGTITLANDETITNAVGGTVAISARTNAVGGLTIGTSKDAAGGVSLVDDLEGSVLNWAEIASGTTLSDYQSTRAIWNRARVTAAQTNIVSIYGSEAQIRVDGVNLGDGVHSGLLAYFEQSGTTVLSTPGINAAAVCTVEGASTLTLDASTTLSGIVVDSAVDGDATMNGNFDAIWIKVGSGKEAWGADIRMQNGETIKNITDGTVEYSGFLGEDLTSATPSDAFTVDWRTGNFQKITITGAALAATFTAPGTTGRGLLMVVQGDGSDTIDWSGVTVLWPGNVEPTLSTGAGDVDLIAFYYDGTSWHGLFNGDFS